VAGPTTEVLNEDIKEVKEDLHGIRVDVDVVKSGFYRVAEDIKELKVDIRDIRGDLAVVKMDLHNVATGLAEFKGETRVYMGLAKWAAAFLITTILTSGGAGIWWASSLTSNVRALEKRFDQFESRIDKLESRFDKFETRFDKLESRFDKFEVQLTKLVEQTRPASPIPKAEGSTNSTLK
jgi:chaperonin cofactor prefoldin